MRPKKFQCALLTFYSLQEQNVLKFQEQMEQIRERAQSLDSSQPNKRRRVAASRSPEPEASMPIATQLIDELKAASDQNKEERLRQLSVLLKDGDSGYSISINKTNLLSLRT